MENIGKAISGEERPGKAGIGICLCLAAAIVIVYAQVANFDFITYFDDGPYVVRNRHVLNGLTWDGFVWAFAKIHAGYWLPLTWLSLMLDSQLYGNQPGMFHLTNLIFHIANALLLFLLLFRMSKAMWRSAFAAALFALHPLHVESVVWITERKDVLSTFFLMLSVSAYLRHIADRKLSSYIALLLCFVLGLMSKPMLVTMPCMLLLLDWWPLGRVGSDNKMRLVTEKIPLFAISIIFSLITFLAQKKGGAVVMPDAYPMYLRMANIPVSYAMYLWKTICPFGLAVFYPLPYHIPVWQIGLSLSCLGLISVAAFRWRQEYPFLPVGWLWYLGTLVPVIGIVQAGTQAMADRFVYIPLIGIYLMIAWGIPLLIPSRHHKTMGAAAAAIIVLLMMRTADQTRHWKNSITLFEHTIRVTENNETAHTDLGLAYIGDNRIGEAIRNFRESVRIDPASPHTHYNLGNAYADQGDSEKAIVHLSEALRLKPEYSDALYRLGYVMMMRGNMEEAVRHLSHAVRLAPDDADAHNDLGVALMRMGKTAEAVGHFSKAAKLRPDDPEIRDNLNKASAMSG